MNKKSLIVLFVIAVLIAILVLPKKEVLVFYPNSLLDPQFIDCSNVFPIKKNISYWKNSEKESIKILLSGPNEKEKEAGYFTSINSGVVLEFFYIKDGIGIANFNKELNKNVAGSCRVISIRSQIEKTLKQFMHIKSVIILIEGKNTEEILQP